MDERVFFDLDNKIHFGKLEKGGLLQPSKSGQLKNKKHNDKIKKNHSEIFRTGKQ